MSMMQILGAFAKNLLDEDEKSRAGIISQSKRTLDNQVCDDDEKLSRTRIGRVTEQSNRTPEHYEQINSTKDTMSNRKFPFGQQVLIEDDEGNVRPLTVLPRPSSWVKDYNFQRYSNQRKAIRNADVVRIANKVTRSVANHIDRMVKKRAMGNNTANALAYNAPVNYAGQPPFHNVNNPFWSIKKHSIAPSHKFSKKLSYCPSCLRRFNSKTKRLDKSKKSDKLKEVKKSKKTDAEKRKTPKRRGLVEMQKPVVPHTDSVNLVQVQKPKTIWAKELLQEFREQAVNREQFDNSTDKETEEEVLKEIKSEMTKGVNKEELPKESSSERVEVIKNRVKQPKTKKVKKILRK